MENNQVTVTGTIMKECELDHSVLGEKFYKTALLVPRTSGTMDEIPILISDRIPVRMQDLKGKTVNVYGEFRSYNNQGEGKKLLLYVFAQEIDFVEEEEYHNKNGIYLEGFLCKQPTYRKTPLGRDIADILIAVNRPYGKSDYIPCVAWGRNAKWASGLPVGCNVQIHGRIQSRVYHKTVSEGCVEERMAYEVSISSMDKVYREESGGEQE